MKEVEVCLGHLADLSDGELAALQKQIQLHLSLRAACPSSPRAAPLANQPAPPPLSLHDLCPSLHQLVEQVRAAPLSADQLALTQAVCMELARARDVLPRLDLAASEIPNFNERLVLFLEKNVLEIRVHLFAPDASETFIHDHQYAFISNCLQGSYLHKLHVVAFDDGTHYRIERRTGGVYSERVECAGTVQNSCAQPFQAGQALFISTMASHTVEPKPGDPVVTVVFRDMRCRNAPATVLVPSADIQVAQDPVGDGLNEERKTRLLARFVNTLRAYATSGATLQTTTPGPLLHDIKDRVNELVDLAQHGEQRLRKLTDRADAQDADLIREALFLAGSVYVWSKFCINSCGSLHTCNGSCMKDVPVDTIAACAMRLGARPPASSFSCLEFIISLDRTLPMNQVCRVFRECMIATKRIGGPVNAAEAQRWLQDNHGLPENVEEYASFFIPLLGLYTF